MTATANLAVTKIEASQAQKEVTANQAFDVFDAALTEKAIALSDGNYTLSTSTTPQEWQYGILKFTGTLTANRNIICPTNKKHYIVVNGTTGGFDLTLKTSGGTGIAVPATKTAILRCDGTNVVEVTPAVSGSNTGDETTTTIGDLIDGADEKTTPVDADFVGLMDSAASNILKKLSWANIKATLKTYFDTLYAPLVQPTVLSFFYPGVPTASALCGVLVAPDGITTLTFDVNIAGSSGKALTAATAQTDFDVRKNATSSANGTSVGTIRFAAAGTVPTFIAGSGFTLDGGTDYLTVWAPASPDASLANIGIGLYATR